MELVRFILILYFHPYLGLPSGLFTLGFPHKRIYAFIISHMRATFPISSFPQRPVTFSLIYPNRLFLLATCTHTQSVFFPWSDRPVFQSITQYSFIYSFNHSSFYRRLCPSNTGFLRSPTLIHL
jgi:hypothetical protein